MNNQIFRPLLNKVGAESGDIFRIALHWYKEQLFKFLGDPEHHVDSPVMNSGQFGGNELPCWRSALSECSCIVACN